MNRKPGIYIPTLYFAEGLPYTVVAMMSGVFLKTLGADNVLIGWTSTLTLPYILKFLWSPLVDYYGTKRAWIIMAQLACAVLCGLVACVAMFTSQKNMSMFLVASFAVFAVTGLASATQDVSIDGYYLDVLDNEQRAFFVGVRNAAYKVAWLFGSGAMVYLAGKIAETHGIGLGWAVAFGCCGVAMLVAGLFHSWYLPRVALVAPVEAAADEVTKEKSGPDFLTAIGTYFVQPSIIPIVIYILIFRLGDALMLKQAPNFLLDPVAKGGLGISVADLGIITGTVGVIALLLGGIVGSWLVSKGGLKRWMWPLALIQNCAILLYWAIAQFPHVFAVHGGLPADINPFLPAVYVVNTIEQFSYGMGVAAYTVFLLSTVRSDHKAAHYATATALMALGMMLPGVLSGYLYKDLGYAHFFLLSFLSSLPGIFAIFFLPLWRADARTESEREADGISEAGQMGREGK